MNGFPLISVIVPVYNRQAYLDKCIKSILSQTYKNIELILVDDGSTDNSPEICDRYAKLDSRVKVIHKENGGVSSSRNIGISNSTGEYIGFIDSDDWVDSNMYATLLAGFGQCPSAGIVSCRIWRAINEEEFSIWEYWSWKISSPTIIKYSKMAESLIDDKFMSSLCNKLFKSEIVKKVSFVEGRNNEDARFFFDIMDAIEEMKADMFELLDLLYYYRATPNSIYNIPKIPLEIDIIKNLEDITPHWNERRPQLIGKLEEKKIAWQIILNQKIQKNKIWRNLYSREWHNKLKKISNRYVVTHFGKRRCLAFFILKFAPFLYRVHFIDKLLVE